MILTEKYALADFNSARKIARAEGREEGIEEGRAEGRAEGRDLTIRKSVVNLMETLHLSAEQAMNALRIPEKEWPEIKRNLK